MKKISNLCFEVRHFLLDLFEGSGSSAKKKFKAESFNSFESKCNFGSVAAKAHQLSFYLLCKNGMGDSGSGEFLVFQLQ